jgi:hypothetical protein
MNTHNTTRNNNKKERKRKRERERKCVFINKPTCRPIVGACIICVTLRSCNEWEREFLKCHFSHLQSCYDRPFLWLPIRTEDVPLSDRARASRRMCVRARSRERWAAAAAANYHRIDLTTIILLLSLIVRCVCVNILISVRDRHDGGKVLTRWMHYHFKISKYETGKKQSYFNTHTRISTKSCAFFCFFFYCQFFFSSTSSFFWEWIQKDLMSTASDKGKQTASKISP